MLRILLDENVPVGVNSLLAGFQARTADEMGWAGMTNGKLLDAAEAAGFQIMITADRNIRAQQRLAGRKIALVIITTNHWDTIRDNAGSVISACSGAGEGTYNVVQLPRPPRRRRTFEPSGS
jgi:predicted nuclease of predicted toxin-antitoxin system